MKLTPELYVQDKVAALRGGGLCHMSAEALQRIAAECTTRRFSQGEQIHWRGQAPDGASWVFSGTVRLFRSSLNGREFTYARLRSAGVFGLLAALDDQPFSVDACAESAVKLAFLPKAALRRLLRETEGLDTALMSILCLKLRHTMDALGEHACVRLEVRLAERLLALAATSQHGTDGTCAVSLATSQDELSQLLGASRQSVNKHLQGWQAQGLIKIERRRLLIQDRDALSRIQ